LETPLLVLGLEKLIDSRQSIEKNHSRLHDYRFFLVRRDLMLDVIGKPVTDFMIDWLKHQCLKSTQG